MNAHDFYNVLEGRAAIGPIRDGIWKYPDEYKDRYNACVRSLLELAQEVNLQLETMTELEKTGFRYTAGGDKAEYAVTT